jgi:hypothetical protein
MNQILPSDFLLNRFIMKWLTIADNKPTIIFTNSSTMGLPVALGTVLEVPTATVETATVSPTLADACLLPIIIIDSKNKINFFMRIKIKVKKKVIRFSPDNFESI